DILMQFLIEASTLSTIGAAMGIALGAAAAAIIRSATPMPTYVAPGSIAVGVLIGAGVGIISGVYPASRASLLDPVTALRQEERDGQDAIGRQDQDVARGRDDRARRDAREQGACGAHDSRRRRRRVRGGRHFG